MAWSTAPTWTHGGVDVSAARLNIISDNLNFLYTALVGDHSAILDMTTGDDAGFIHQWRWLHYITRTGEQGSVKATGQTDVQLESSESVMAVFDLADVSWLTQGMAYRVTGCKYAAEDWEA